MESQNAKNTELIAIFTELQTIAEILGSTYRENAYRKAVSELKKLDFRIDPTNLDLLTKKKIPGIGTGIMSKIREFITTGKIEELDRLRQSREVQAYREFSKILGVGPSTIRKWLNMRVDSLAKLRRAIGDGKIILTHVQKLGLKHYDDLNTRIPRKEVEQLGMIVKSILLTLDPNIIFEILGSYRRGAPNSGDVDILVSNKNHFDEDLVSELVASITNDPNFVDVLTAGSERVTILYKSPVSNKVRQIDILNIAYGSYFAALNYFTGGFVHNTWLRGVAKSRGYRLNQAGLFKYTGKSREKIQIVPVHSEEEIYKLLNVPYIPPAERL